MSISKKKLISNAKYDVKNMVSYTVKYNKKLYEQVQLAVNNSGLTRNGWTVQAIKEKLQRDGYNV